MIRATLEWLILFVLATLVSVIMTPMVLCDGGCPRVTRLWSGWWQCLSAEDCGVCRES